VLEIKPALLFGENLVEPKEDKENAQKNGQPKRPGLVDENKDETNDTNKEI
jgi:hypothetical protein